MFLFYSAVVIKDVCLLAYFENQLHKEWEMKRRKNREREREGGRAAKLLQNDLK
jgi:hypothetical protein